MVIVKRSLPQIFLVPALIAGVIIFGLVSALLGDGPWDEASWIALAAPLAIIGFHVCRRAARRQI
jgi:amino acid transporter